MLNNLPRALPANEFMDLEKILLNLQRHWKLLFLFLLVCLMGAAVISATIPSKWKATATLQIGQLPVNPTTLIETPTETAARFSQRQLQDQALTMLGLPLDPLDQEKGTQIFRKTLKATTGVNTNFVEISVAAYSAENAKAYLHAAINSLSQAHDAKLAPLLKNLDERIANNHTQINVAILEKARLEKSLEMGMKTSSLSNQAKFEPSVLAMNLISTQNDLLRHLNSDQTNLVDLRTKVTAFPTMIVNAIYAPASPYSPQLSLFLVLGGLVGLILGIGSALFIDRKRIMFDDTRP